MSQVRVRFAPSPTGYLHVGNARTAVLNWLFAKHTHGKFVLRIEDTDLERSTEEFHLELLKDLDWLGLDWDEGPDKGGEFGPYRQSERLQVYREHAQRLMDEGHAFRCYCSAEEIKTKSDEAIRLGKSTNYDGTCYDLTADRIQNFENEGRKQAIRFRVPEGVISFRDVVHDEVAFDSESISDFVILRADGIATYNFAAAIDDSLMKISHVVRGEDHLSNTPKQMLIYNALGLPLPAFVHIPMILGKDRSKLSKRHGDNQVRQYREKGYLPEAMINFLSLLSWSSPTGDELLSVDRLIGEFDLERLSKAAAIFDTEKFNWMNGWYLRNAEFDRMVNLSVPILKNAGLDVSDRRFVEKCIEAVISRVDYLQQLPEQCAIFFSEEVKYENESAIKSQSSKKIFKQFLCETNNLSGWNAEVFRETMKAVQKETSIKGKELWMPLRIALTGLEHGPELPVVIEILGLEKSRRFVERALNY
ncbi:MAG: glutamate--tRNA ligase [bacterium]